MPPNQFANPWPFGRQFAWLVLLSVLVGVFQGFYIFSGRSYSPLAEFFASATMPVAVMIWVVWDARSRRCTPCWDFGLMVYLGWLLVVPGYLIWTRGWRGILLLFAFICLIFLPVFLPMVAWAFMHGG